MKKLISGIVDFRKNVRPRVKDTFAQLALGQRPDVLFIACSDSRVVPNVFASSDPGDLLVVRNVGNMIPSCGDHGHSVGDEAEVAAIEFALLSLPITEIIVCGHSECGAMVLISQGREKVDAPHLRNWLRHGEASLDQLSIHKNFGSGDLERHNQLSQSNVLLQIEHLKTYPLVKRRLAEGTLRLNGWWFDIKEANVYGYEEAERRFILIDEQYAPILLKRAEENSKK